MLKCFHTEWDRKMIPRHQYSAKSTGNGGEPVLFHSRPGFGGQKPAGLFIHSEIGQGLSYTSQINLFLQLAVPGRKGLPADPVKCFRISPGSLNNQRNSPRSENSACGASRSIQPLLDKTQGFLRSERPEKEASPNVNPLVDCG